MSDGLKIIKVYKGKYHMKKSVLKFQIRISTEQL